MEKARLLEDIEEEQVKKVSPYREASIFSILTFRWLDPLLNLGSKRPLQAADLPYLGNEHSASADFHAFRKRFTYNQGKSAQNRVNLPLLLVNLYRKDVVHTGIISLLLVLASYTGPALIDEFVKNLGESSRTTLGIALGFFLAKVGENVLQRQQHFRLQLLGLHVQSGLTAYVYWKGLRLSSICRQDYTSGKLVNYTASDVQAISSFCWELHSIWVLPLQVVIGLIILYRSVGIAALASVVTVIFCIACNIPLATLQGKSQDRMMHSKDKRLKATSESLKNMRTLKFLGWEGAFLQNILNFRSEEYSWISKCFYVQAISKYISSASPILMAALTFAACKLLYISLTPGKLLATLATFRVMQNIQDSVPVFASSLAQVHVSLNRLSRFFEENESSAEDYVKKANDEEKFAVRIYSGSFSWEGNQVHPTLSDIDLDIPKGGFIGVCGPVGSGKSTLLSCMLGHVPKLSGEVQVNGSTAYVSQSPWIQSGTIRENILFGRPMDTDRYKQVLAVCQLSKDLEMLINGDETHIGDRGVNLSGGQKQRVQIARALYQDADIYLLDDPLSSLDSETANSIFKECILGELRSKTVVLVTHQLQSINTADKLVFIEDGKITRDDYNLTVDNNTESTRADSANEGTLEYVPKNAKHELDEERRTGSVDKQVYWAYLTTVYGGLLIPVILLVQLIYQGLMVGSTWWISTMASSIENTNKIIVIYVLLSIGIFTVLTVRILLGFTIGLMTGQRFFENFYQSVFRAPMSFFDLTPIGRILNRASTDQTAVDLSLPMRLSEFVDYSVQLVAILGIFCFVVWPVLWIFIPLAVCAIWIQSYYIKSIRELPRLLEMQRAPVLHHLEESISGVYTIRAFNQELRFLNKMLNLVDLSNTPRFHNFASMESLALRLGLFADFLFCILLIFLLIIPIDPTTAGVAVTYGLDLTLVFIWCLWSRVDVEKRMVSVERMLQYSHLQKESVDLPRPPVDWPSLGKIDFCNVKVGYRREGPVVLHGITCSFEGGSKVGIVGRTGSGKSTIIQALFRILEPMCGKIFIDGVDISTIDLESLRSAMGMIPQDPVLFEGSIRYNLDPHDKYTDHEIFEVLCKCQLDQVVQSKGKGIYLTVSENGENWSLGQRQLLCLARIMLKQTKILVMDEATASMDHSTEGIIQSRIANEFQHSTVITVAHRLATLVENTDVILVLQDGRIAEMGASSMLAKDTSSIFYTMLGETVSSSSSSFFSR